MMAFGRGWPAPRGDQRTQYAAPPSPVMSEVMQLRAPAMPMPSQMPAGVAGGLADGLRRIMAQRQQMSAYPVSGRTPLEWLFGADPSLGSRIPAQRPTLTPYGVGDAPIGGFY